VVVEHGVKLEVYYIDGIVLCCDNYSCRLKLSFPATKPTYHLGCIIKEDESQTPEDIAGKPGPGRMIGWVFRIHWWDVPNKFGGMVSGSQPIFRFPLGNYPVVR